ncbi:MAG: hypothetical protein ABI165_08290 [Bryobacteraceae bacterium]
MTAAPLPLVNGVIVTVVAPAALFFAYQMSTTSLAPESTARAGPASPYAFPPLSVTALIVGE